MSALLDNAESEMMIIIDDNRREIKTQEHHP